MTEKTDVYQELGVDAGKGSVRAAFGDVIDNDHPNAFVNIIGDRLTPGMATTQHSDGDGSKPIQRVLCFLETGDPSVFAGAVDDAVGMNTGDVGAGGFLNADGDGCQTWTNSLNISDIPSKRFKEAVMAAFAQRFRALLYLYTKHGFEVALTGGETADLPDQVMTLTFDVTVNAREPKRNIITGHVVPDDVIYGFSSGGQATWEDQPNSGIMSNGLTMAGAFLGCKSYSDKYPYLRVKNPFRGRYKINSTDPLLGDMPVFEALLSPTRQWAFLIRMLVVELKKRGCLDMLHGISMNTGGGATKIGHVGANILYRKKMPEALPLFQLIHREVRHAKPEFGWREMFKNFNCGVGLDVVGQDHPEFYSAIRTVSEQANVSFYELGYTEPSDTPGNEIVLETPYGDFDY